MDGHKLDRRTVLQVAQERPRFRRNKKGRAATHQMVGPDQGGAFWSVYIRQVTGQPGLWRAITGWAAERRHRLVPKERLMSENTGPEATKDDRALAEQLYASRHDPDEWEEAPAEVRVKPVRNEVVSFRVPSDFLNEIEQAAGAEGSSLSEFIRKALAAYMRGTSGEALLMDVLVDIHHGGSSGLILRTPLQPAGRTEHPQELETALPQRIPDFPPDTVADLK